MKVILLDTLKKRNKSRYWLSLNIGVTQNAIRKLCNNETSSITFDLMEKICKALDCTPNDIFEVQ